MDFNSFPLRGVNHVSAATRHNSPPRTEKTAWVSAVMVEADEMTEGETKFEDLFAAPK